MIRAGLNDTILKCDTLLLQFSTDLNEVESHCTVSAVSPAKNDHVCEKFRIVREALAKCVGDLQKLSRWISLMIPPIEDGNNFGVAVQGEVLKVVNEKCAQIYGLFQALPGYHKDRASAWKEVRDAVGTSTNTVTKKEEKEGDEQAKKTVCTESKEVAGQNSSNHPDGVAHIVALDVQTYFHLYNSLQLVRDTYIIIGDAIEKNIAKIEAPKGTGGGSRSAMSLY